MPRVRQTAWFVKRKRKMVDSSEAPSQEKKERQQVHRPEILWGSNIRIAFTSNLPARYKIPHMPSEVRFLYAKCHEGPDRLGVFPREDSGDSTAWFIIYRKTEEDKAHRVVFEGTGTESVEMQGVTENSMFRITGPGGFNLRLVCEPKQDPRLIAIAKERELIAKVLLIRKEYEETVLPHLPVSVQFTGAMVLGSLLPSVTVELRKGQLEDAEKQLASQ